jgi:hypothetical protein
VRAHYLRQLFLPALFAFAALTMAPAADAQTPTWAQAGMLRCRLNPSIGFVIFGHQSMECSFQPVSGPVQGYEGAINTVGLDLGVSEGGRFAWAVFGPATGMPDGALAGEYVGASGDVGIGVGVGANVLSGAQIVVSPCNPSRLKGRLRLTSLLACRNCNYGRPASKRASDNNTLILRVTGLLAYSANRSLT